MFDTTYYVFLWLKKSGEKYYGSPTDSSTGTCYVPWFIWQTTQYTFYTNKADTSYWVNGKVRFITPPSLRSEYFQAKIHAYTPFPSTLTGFVDSLGGQSIYFIDQGITDQTFYVGLKCTDLSPYSLQDVRVYRFDSVTGRWLVNRNTLSDAASSTSRFRSFHRCRCPRQPQRAVYRHDRYPAAAYYVAGLRGHDAEAGICAGVRHHGDLGQCREPPLEFPGGACRAVFPAQRGATARP